jgi:sulfur carrier protein
MNITINGQDLTFDQKLSIKNFLDTKNINMDSVVVELNQTIIPSEKYHTTWLTHNDKLEILRFVGGG